MISWLENFLGRECTIMCTSVRECDLCQRYKVAQTGPEILMENRLIERPWAVVAVDAMEFRPSKAQNKYLLVFQDLFTRWTEIKPLRKAGDKAVSRAIEELILSGWETPLYLLSDNGKEFDDIVVKIMLEEYRVKHIITSPYHPQANPVERSNCTFKAMISKFVGADHRNWDIHIHEFRHAVNTARQASTKVFASYLNSVRQPQPVESSRREVEGPRVIEKIEPGEFEDRTKRLNALRDLVGRHTDIVRQTQERHYNKGRRHVKFGVGNRVLRRIYFLSDAAKKFNVKFTPKFEGPFEVTEILSPMLYVLRS